MNDASKGPGEKETPEEREVLVGWRSKCWVFPFVQMNSPFDRTEWECPPNEHRNCAVITAVMNCHRNNNILLKSGSCTMDVPSMLANLNVFGPREIAGKYFSISPIISLKPVTCSDKVAVLSAGVRREMLFVMPEGRRTFHTGHTTATGVNLTP
jgi:hypothetical protein